MAKVPQQVVCTGFRIDTFQRDCGQFGTGSNDPLFHLPGRAELTRTYKQPGLKASTGYN